MKKIYIFALLLLIHTSKQFTQQQAVCIVPIAELVGAPFGKDAEKRYKSLFLEGDNACAIRIGQLLFNEIVTITETRYNECKIDVTDHFYSSSKKNKKMYTYWTLRKNLLLMNDIHDKKVIPAPFKDQTKDDNTIVLNSPFYDRKNRRHYSAGTRFVLTQATPVQKNRYQVNVLTTHNTTKTIFIPKKYCFTYSNKPDKQIKRFLKIIKQYAHPLSGHIPYAWGGMSHNAHYKHPFKKQYYPEKIGYNDGKQLRYFQTKKPHTGPYSGLDCAGLILRSAQIAGIPLYAKNSSALKNTLQPLSPNEKIEDGDIIYIPGHVMIISNKDKNYIIEARTQCDNYGYVHEIPLSEEFPKLKTITDLYNAHKTKKRIKRVNKHGNKIAKLPITILKLRSIYKQ